MEGQSEDNLDAKKKSYVKNKFTTYLNEEAENALTELYIHRLRKNRIDRRTARSQIVCEALIELYKKECGENGLC